MNSEPQTEDPPLAAQLAESQAEARNPYGEVALGVECAWPESIPAVEATEAEAA